jgi:hypothetical protein
VERHTQPMQLSAVPGGCTNATEPAGEEALLPQHPAERAGAAPGRQAGRRTLGARCRSCCRRRSSCCFCATCCSRCAWLSMVSTFRKLRPGMLSMLLRSRSCTQGTGRHEGLGAPDCRHMPCSTNITVGKTSLCKLLCLHERKMGTSSPIQLRTPPRHQHTLK